MLDEVWLSVQGNLSMLRERTNIYWDLAINLGTGIIGILVWWFTSGWAEFAGIVIAILGFGAIVAWVLGL